MELRNIQGWCPQPRAKFWKVFLGYSKIPCGDEGLSRPDIFVSLTRCARRTRSLQLALQRD